MALKPHEMQIFLTVTQVAERYGVSVDSIWRWKRNGGFPAPVRLGPNCTRWRHSDLVAHEQTLKAGFCMTVDFLVAA